MTTPKKNRFRFQPPAPQSSSESTAATAKSKSEAGKSSGTKSGTQLKNSPPPPENSPPQSSDAVLDSRLHILKTSDDPDFLAQACREVAFLAKNEMNREAILSKGGIRLLADSACKIYDMRTLRIIPGIIADIVDKCNSLSPEFKMNMNEDKAILMWLSCSPNRSNLVIVKDSNNDGIECYKYFGNNPEKAPDSVGFRGVRCTLVGSSFYYIGGMDTESGAHPYPDTCMSFIDTSNLDDGWKSFDLPFYTSHVKTVVWRNFIYIFPGDFPFFYEGVDDLKFGTPRPAQYPENPSQPYIYDTVKNQGCDIPLPTLPSGLRVLPSWYNPGDSAPYNLSDEFWEQFFLGFRVCAAWDEKGLLVSVFGDENFYLHVPSDEPGLGWTSLPLFKPLPEFRGRLPCKYDFPPPKLQSLSAVLNATLYCCDIPDRSENITPILHVYDLNEGSVESSHDLPCLSLGNINWSMLPLADGELSFIGFLYDPNYCETFNGNFIYLKVKVSKESAKVAKDMSFRLPFTTLEGCNFMLIDTRQLQIDVPGDKVERIEGRLLVSQQPQLKILETYEMKIKELEEQLQKRAPFNDQLVLGSSEAFEKKIRELEEQLCEEHVRYRDLITTFTSGNNECDWVKGSVITDVSVANVLKKRKNRLKQRVHSILSTNVGSQREALTAIVMHAAEGVCLEEIMREWGFGSLHILSTQSTDSTSVDLTYAAISLLAMDVRYQDVIMSHGGARLLAKAAFHARDKQSYRRIAKSIFDLCLFVSDDKRERTTDAGEIETLLMQLEMSPSVRRSASGLIAELSLKEANQELIAKGAPVLLKAVVEGDLYTCRMVACALSNLCGNKKLHKGLLDGEFIVSLARLLWLNNLEVSEQVARGVSYFESRALIRDGENNGRSVLLEHGVVEKLIAMLHSFAISPSTRRIVELALCCLALNDDNAKDIIYKRAAEELVQISDEYSGSDDDIRTLAKVALSGPGLNKARSGRWATSFRF